MPSFEQQPPMSPEQFAAIIADIKEKYQDDPELCHAEMDHLMCQLLTDLGYATGVDMFVHTNKWYA